MEKYGHHTLKLAFPPFSNQEAEWLWKDGEIKPLVANSKLYMIGHRKQAKFEYPSNPLDENGIRFNIRCGNELTENISMPLDQFDFVRESKPLVIEMGEKLIRFQSKQYTDSNSNKPTVYHWLTPDRLFYFLSEDSIICHGLEHLQRFSEFDLYYVGISKKNDSFSRLFETSHEKRSRILGNESQMEPTARLTDELMIFLFEVEDLQIRTYEPNDDFSDIGLGEIIDPAILAADAEKALVKIMQSSYNEEKYDNFPKSKDGLYREGFKRYGFTIQEDLTFKTKTAKIRGARRCGFPENNPCDMIFIEGDDVILLTHEDMKKKC